MNREPLLLERMEDQSVRPVPVRNSSRLAGSFQKVNEAEQKIDDKKNEDCNPQGTDYSLIDRVIDLFKMEANDPDTYMTFQNANHLRCLTRHFSDPNRVITIRDQYEICFLDIDSKDFHQAYIAQSELISFVVNSEGLMLLFSEQGLELLELDNQEKYQQVQVMNQFNYIRSMKLTSSEDTLYVCESGQYLRDCKVSRVQLKDNQLTALNAYQHDKPLQDIRLAEDRGILFVLDVIIGGPVDLRKSKILLLDMVTMEVVREIEKLQPTIQFHVSKDSAKLLYKEEKGYLLKVHDIMEDRNLCDIVTQLSQKTNCIIVESASFYFICGDEQITVLDNKTDRIVCRLPLMGFVTAACLTKNEEKLFIVTRFERQCRVYLYELGKQLVEPVHELEGTRYFITCPHEEEKFLAATSEGTLKKVHFDTLNSEESMECRHRIARIASNKEGTIGFVVIQNQHIQRINLRTFEADGDMITDITGAVQNIFVCEIVSKKKEYLFVCANRGNFKKYDIHTGIKLQEIANFDDDFIGLTYIKSLNVLVSGTGQGKVRLINASDFFDDQYINGQKFSSPHELLSIGGGIRSIGLSAEEKFFAIGEYRGPIRLMRTDQIHLNIEYARFDYHKDQVWEIKFIQRGSNLLMASTSYDGKFVVTSIDELQVIFNMELDMMPRNMIFHPEADFMYLINNEWQVHKINFDFFELSESKKALSLPFNIMRHCMNTDNTLESISCIPHVKDDIFLLKKINILGLLARKGDARTIQSALDLDVHYLRDVEGNHPIDYCYKRKNFDGIKCLVEGLNKKGVNYMDKRALYFAILNSPKFEPFQELIISTLFKPIGQITRVNQEFIGYLQNQQNQLIFTDEMHNMNQKLLKDQVEFQHPEERTIKILSSRIALNLETGSTDSIQFMSIISMANNEQLYTPLCYFVDYKWSQNWPAILRFSALYVLHMIAQMCFIVVFLENKLATFSVLAMNALMLLLEIWIQCNSGGKSSCLLVLGHLLMCTFCALSFYRVSKEGLKVLLAVSTLIFAVRVLKWMMVFRVARRVIDQVDRTVRDLVPYLVSVVAATIVTFGCLDYALLLIDQRSVQKVDGEEAVPVSLMARMQSLLHLMLGFATPSTSLSPMQVLFGLVMHVVLMQVLLALALNTDERLKFTRRANEYKLKVEFILFIERLLYWKRDLGTPKYLHVLRYSQVDHEEDESQWDGTDRTLLFKQDKAILEVNQLRQEMAQLRTDMQQENEQIKQEFRKLIVEEMAEVKALIRDNNNDGFNL